MKIDITSLKMEESKVESLLPQFQKEEQRSLKINNTFEKRI